MAAIGENDSGRKGMNLTEENGFFQDDVLLQLLEKIRGMKVCGKETFRDVLKKRLPSLNSKDIPAWKRMRRYIGKDEEFSTFVYEYLRELPSLDLDVFLALCQELVIDHIESLFFLSAERNVTDYIVLLLQYLSDLGIQYTWYDLFQRLHEEGKDDSIKHIMLASGQDATVFLNVFENVMQQDKKMVTLIFEAFPSLEEEDLHTIATESSSEVTRETAASLLHDIESCDLPDPFEGTECENSIAGLSTRLEEDLSTEQQELEKAIVQLYGPLNAYVGYKPSEESFCSRYGGCRLYTCLCREEEEKWFSHKCGGCKGEITTKYEACRIPHLNGGWSGCYCSPECFRIRDKKKCIKRWHLIEDENE